MAIDISCPKCLRTYHLKDHLAGKKVRCTECKQVFPVPGDGPAGLMMLGRGAHSANPPADEVFDEDGEPSRWDDADFEWRGDVPNTNAAPASPPNDGAALQAAPNPAPPPPVPSADAFSPAPPPDYPHSDSSDADLPVPPLAPQRVSLDDSLSGAAASPPLPPHPHPAPPPEMASPLPPPPAPGPGTGTETASQSVSVFSGSAIDEAFDTSKVTFAMQCGAIWGVGMAAALTLSMLGLILAAIPIAVLVTYAVTILAVSGLSFLASRKMQLGITPHWSAAWEQFLRHSGSLLFGTIGALIGAALLLVFLFGGIFALTLVPAVGSILGGLLVLPTTFFLLFALAMIIGLYMLPIVIGVEDCGVIAGVKIVFRLAKRNQLSLAMRIAVAVLSILPAAILTAGLLGGAFFLATMVCGSSSLMSLSQGFDPGALIVGLSAVVAIALWLGFMLVYSTEAFTRVYLSLTSRT